MSILDKITLSHESYSGLQESYIACVEYFVLIFSAASDVASQSSKNITWVATIRYANRRNEISWKVSIVIRVSCVHRNQIRSYSL